MFRKFNGPFGEAVTAGQLQTRRRGSRSSPGDDHNLLELSAELRSEFVINKQRPVDLAIVPDRRLLHYKIMQHAQQSQNLGRRRIGLESRR